MADMASNKPKLSYHYLDIYLKNKLISKNKIRCNDVDVRSQKLL